MKEFIEELPPFCLFILSIPFSVMFVILVWVTVTHFHYYSKPIVSMYWGFNSRKIIYECKCGKRRSELVHRRFGDPFPIETTSFIDHKEFNEILNGGDTETVLGYKYKSIN